LFCKALFLLLPTTTSALNAAFHFLTLVAYFLLFCFYFYFLNDGCGLVVLKAILDHFGFFSDRVQVFYKSVP
jgi:hypothetical protein